jgi:hypothetical protein
MGALKGTKEVWCMDALTSICLVEIELVSYQSPEIRLRAKIDFGSLMLDWDHIARTRGAVTPVSITETRRC